MAATTILIEDELGLRVPRVPSVPIVAGETLTFTAAEGADAVLYFSPSTAAILTPSPEGPISLLSGASVSYSFTAIEDHAYGVIVQAPEVSAPRDFDFGPPAAPPRLVITAGSGASFPGPTNPIKTGR